MADVISEAAQKRIYKLVSRCKLFDLETYYTDPDVVGGSRETLKVTAEKNEHQVSVHHFLHRRFDIIRDGLFEEIPKAKRIFFSDPMDPFMKYIAAHY